MLQWIKNLKLNQILSIVVIILLILITILYIVNHKDKNLANDYNNLKQLYETETTTFKDKEGKLNTRVDVLQLNNFNLLNDMNTKNTSILRLQSMLEDAKGINTKLQTLLAISNQTIIMYSDSLDNLIVRIDSFLVNGQYVKYPVYQKNIDMFKGWITGTITLGKTSSDINIITRSQYDITIGQHRKNIFKPFTYYANCKSLSPYDVTKEFVVVQQKPKVNRFNVSASIGYGIGVNGLTPFVGITGGYNIITF
jgi:hypothetical protein